MCTVTSARSRSSRRAGCAPPGGSRPARSCWSCSPESGADDRVVLEVSGNAWEIARIIEPHVARVIVVCPSDTGIRHARAKTDRLDARTLARLLAAGLLDGVWMPDERTRVMRRRLARRAQLVRGAHAREERGPRGLGAPAEGAPAVAICSARRAARGWRELELPVEERETVDSGAAPDRLPRRRGRSVDRVIADDALDSPEARRLMTVPGVNLIAAATFLAAVGDIGRFPDRRKLVGYLGLDPRSASPAMRPPRMGRSPSRARPRSRVALVEAGWSAVRQPGPLRAFYQRVRARRGHQIAIVAAARKLACLFWVLLWRRGLRLPPALADRQEAPPARVHRRRAALARPKGIWMRTAAPRRRTRPRPPGRARLRADRPRPASRGQIKAGASVTPGRASQQPTRGQSRAADHKPLTSALRYVSHPRPPRTIPQEAPPTKPT